MNLWKFHRIGGGGRLAKRPRTFPVNINMSCSIDQSASIYSMRN